MYVQVCQAYVGWRRLQSSGSQHLLTSAHGYNSQIMLIPRDTKRDPQVWRWVLVSSMLVPLVIAVHSLSSTSRLSPNKAPRREQLPLGFPC